MKQAKLPYMPAQPTNVDEWHPSDELGPFSPLYQVSTPWTCTARRLHFSMHKNGGAIVVLLGGLNRINVIMRDELEALGA